MHKNKCTHHGDPPSPRLADGHHDALVGVHALYNLYNPHALRHAPCGGSTTLQPSTALYSPLQLYSSTSSTLYKTTTLYNTPQREMRQRGDDLVRAVIPSTCARARPRCRRSPALVALVALVALAACAGWSLLHTSVTRDHLILFQSSAHHWKVHAELSPIGDTPALTTTSCNG